MTYFRKNFEEIHWKLQKKLRKCEKFKKQKQKTVKNTSSDTRSLLTDKKKSKNNKIY